MFFKGHRREMDLREMEKYVGGLRRVVDWMDGVDFLAPCVLKLRYRMEEGVPSRL